MLVFTGSGRSLPLSPVRMKPKENSPNEELLCVHYMTQGFECNRKRQCKRAHKSSLQDVPAVKQQELITFIGEHPDYKFANGCGPAGRNAPTS